MIRRGFYCHPMKKTEYHNIFHYPTSVIHSVSSWPTWVNYCLISFTKWISFDFMSFFWPWLVYMLEKAMATHSSTLAWKIKWTEELGRLQSMGSRRVGHDWATSLSLFTFMHWRKKWQPTPVFLPGESQRRGNLVGCYLWGRTELDMTEAT